jgi:NAD(P)-dependent dehydrogenase (short-subunit alcohol dehydrogenase family)
MDTVRGKWALVTGASSGFGVELRLVWRNLQLISLKDQRIVVTGGSRGLGLGIVQALAARGARVTVVARGRKQLGDVERLGAEMRAGDATDAALMDGIVAEVSPSVLILNAGAIPFMAPLDEQTWDTFCTVWNTDVKAGLHGIQAALKTPLASGSRTILMSSGAATHGAPLSGSYSGAKRMLWFMAHYANDIARERGLEIHFQVLAPLQMIDTVLIRQVAGAYAKRQRTSIEAVMQSRYGNLPLSVQQFGEQVAVFLSDPQYATGVAYGIKAETGIKLLDTQ